MPETIPTQADTPRVQPDQAPLTINPCIFVGIGTTGLRILEALRQLFYEEFGVAGLPCFRYLVLETDRNSRPNDGFLPHPPAEGERINLIPITIPDLEAVKTSPELMEWLDERTLKFGLRGYESGAGHRRQAGRLCLWENWTSVRDAVTQAVQQVGTPESHDEADRFLRANYFARRQPQASLPAGSLVNQVPRVYLTGTLCGGTCSGVFLDLAYLFRSLLQVRSHSNLRDTGSSEIIGQFTIPDTMYQQSEQALPHVASCWAALIELDFYSKDETVYELRLPNQPRFSTREPPFTTAYLVSKRHMGRAGFTEEDAEGLPQMCAMNLFTEVVAGMAAAKAANRVNLPAAGQGFFEVNSSGYIRAFSSFGLSAIWYPRYRIAKAICRSLGAKMAEDWLGHPGFQPAKVEEAARADWEATLEWARGSLMGTVQKAHCSEHLPNRIMELFERQEPVFRQTDREGMDDYIRNFPGGETTLGQRLNPGGEYYRCLENAQTLLTPDFREQLRKRVVQYLREHTFAETTHYLKTLEKHRQDEERRIPVDLPAYAQQQDLSRADEVYEDRWTWALGLRQAAINEFKQQVWAQFRQRTQDHLEQLRDQFLRQTLTNVKGYLNNLSSELARIEQKLKTFRTTCSREQDELVRCPQASNVVVLSQGTSDSIQDDVELGVATILRGTTPEQLRGAFLGRQDKSPPSGSTGEPEDKSPPSGSNEHDPLELIAKPVEALLTQLERAYAPMAQDQVARFQIGDQALHVPAARLQTLVHFSSPYFEPSPEWRPMATPQPSNFVFCSRSDTAADLANQANQYLSGTTFDPKTSPLGHFVFFYQETPGLALSDLAIRPFAAERLDAEEAKPDNPEPTRYTHKLGRRKFDPKAIKKTARQWAEDTRALAPGLFQTVGNQPCLVYSDSNGLRRELYVEDEASVGEFTLEHGLDGLIRLLAERLATVGKDNLLQAMNQRVEKAATREEREALTQRHEEILKTVFPP